MARREAGTAAGVAPLLLFLLLAATGAEATIRSSSHDFSSESWSRGEICIACHTPHNAKIPQTAPLWNHLTSTASYTLYASPTMDNPVGQPGNASKACLSCHDGTIAVDSYGSITGTRVIGGTPGTPGSANLGTDLSDDHPIGIGYHADRPAQACRNCHSMHGGGRAALLNALLPFYDGKIECATCHDVHNVRVAAGPNLLRITVSGSEICLHCHSK